MWYVVLSLSLVSSFLIYFLKKKVPKYYYGSKCTSSLQCRSGYSCLLSSEINIAICQCNSTQYYDANVNQCVNLIGLNQKCTLNDKCILNATCTLPYGGVAYLCQCTASTYNLNGVCGKILASLRPFKLLII